MNSAALADAQTFACAVCSVLSSAPFCARCALASALPEAEARIGAYIVLGALEGGGSCTVHIARRDGHDGLVVIKLAKPELIATSDGLAAYRSGLRIQRSLCRQPNILSIEEIGTHDDGRPYAVMALLDGGTLADPGVRARYRDPAAALSLMFKLARAVARAHQRGVLHADLKPDNILFDDDEEPFISDFGLARLLGHAADPNSASFQGGTPGWMSPEQAERGELTLASDVFSLGVLLYWLLTARLPFGAGHDFAQRVCEQELTPLCASYRGEHAWELEQICARALRKNPEGRYRSAAEFADELQRVVEGRTIEAERARPLRRLQKWSRRHKLAALLVIQLVLSALYLPFMPLLGLHELRAAMRAQLSFSAEAQAGAVANALHAISERVAQVAREPEIKRLLAHDDPRNPPASLAPLAAGLDGVSVFSAQGILRARWPKHRVMPPVHVDYGFRDYIKGAQRYARAGSDAVYVARPFHSAGDNEPLLALSTPLFDQGRHVGVLTGSTRARDTIGAVRMDCRQGGCMSALLGPRDRDQAHQPLPNSIFVLAAPGMSLGRELMIAAPLARQICARLDCKPDERDQFAPARRAGPLLLDDYVDPISGTRSLAALAPVGRTGLIVVVATPHDALTAIIQRIREQLLHYLWVPIVSGLALFVALHWLPRLPLRTQRAKR